jgi:hypothetical protein
MSVTVIQGGPSGYFIPISITTPVASALKSCCIIWSFQEVPADTLNHFLIQVAVLLLKRPLHNRFRSEMVTYKFIAVIISVTRY